MPQLRRFIVEHDLPGVGRMSQAELCGAAEASNAALDRIGSAVQWQHSYVAGDKTFCVYLADGKDTIRRHAELSGFPATAITEVATIIDPTTATP